MLRLLILLALPYWVYFPVAAGVGYLAEEMYKSELQKQHERVLALEQAPPALVNLSQFRRDTHISPVREVNVEGWINSDYNYNLTKSTNGKQTGKRFMHLLFGQGDTADSKVVRAALVLTAVEKERFMSDLDTFATGWSASDKHFTFGFNGFASASDGYASLVKDALKEQGLRASPDFVYISPFFNGREVALAPQGAPEDIRKNVWLFAAAIALFGLMKFMFGRKTKKTRAQSEMAANPSYTVPRSKGALADTIAADSPLGRLHGRTENDGMNRETAVPAMAAFMPAAAAAPTPRSAEKPAKKFPVKLALLAIIVVATAINPKAVGVLLPILFIGGFWALTYFGANKINKMASNLFQKATTLAKAKPSSQGMAPPASPPLEDDLSPIPQRMAGRQAMSLSKSAVPGAAAKPAQSPAVRDSFSDGPIRSGSDGLFGRLRKKKSVDPFEKLAQARKSF